MLLLAPHLAISVLPGSFHLRGMHSVRFAGLALTLNQELLLAACVPLDNTPRRPCQRIAPFVPRALTHHPLAQLHVTCVLLGNLEQLGGLPIFRVVLCAPAGLTQLIVEERVRPRVFSVVLAPTQLL
jgi:hypothetical protein